MASHELEAMFSCSALASRQEQILGEKDAVQASATLSATIPSGRRCEERMEYCRQCSYEVFESIEEGSVVIERGEAFSINQSTDGMLLLMGQAPHEKKLIEVHTPRSKWGRTVHVFETRWTKPVQVESLGNLYLVGCRRIFGPCYYLVL